MLLENHHELRGLSRELRPGTSQTAPETDSNQGAKECQAPGPADFALGCHPGLPTVGVQIGSAPKQWSFFQELRRMRRCARSLRRPDAAPHVECVRCCKLRNAAPKRAPSAARKLTCVMSVATSLPTAQLVRGHSFLFYSWGRTDLTSGQQSQACCVENDHATRKI